MPHFGSRQGGIIALTPDEMTFYLAVGSLMSMTIITLAKIIFLHQNPNGNGVALKP